MSISAVIITKNEENLIVDAIDAVGFCDEVVVVDNNSSDRTAEIAEQLGAKIFKLSVKDFSKLRNFGKDKSKSEWILYIDADERVSKDLAEEIKNKINQSNGFVAYRLPRKNFYLGKNEWPKVEKMERLFKKENLLKWEGTLHETAKVDGRIGDLKSPLLHFTHRNLNSMVKKTNEWSETEAKNRLIAHHPRMSWWRFPRVMITSFLDYYIKQRGYRLGTTGLIESIYQSYSTFITYAKLWELQKKES